MPTTRLCGHTDRPFDTKDECAARSFGCPRVLSGAAAHINEPKRNVGREQSVHPRFDPSEERIGAQTIEAHDQTIGITSAIDLGPHTVGGLAHEHRLPARESLCERHICAAVMDGARAADRSRVATMT